MALLRDYIALYVSPVLEFFAEHAVRNADRIVSMQREHAAGNRQRLLDWARDRPGTVRVAPPDGGVSALVHCPRHGDVTDLCRRLAEEHRVLLVPGSCFGDAYAGHARLGFGGATRELTVGLERLGLLLDQDASADGPGPA